jgi:hypothetical protein
LARIAAVVPDLMFGSRVQSTLESAGHEVEVAPSLEAAELAGAEILIADLNEVDLAALAAAGPPVLGFYSHVDVERRRKAEDAGLALVVPRSRMAREMPDLVERVIGS